MMFARRASRFIAAVAIATLFATGTAASAATPSIRTLGAQQLRLATIGYRIAAANARTCVRPEMMSGMIVHELTQYTPSARAAVSQAFSLNDGIGVLQIVPGSAAERAGFQIDDEILAVGGVGVEDPSTVRRGRQTYARIKRFSATLSAALATGPTQLIVRRRGDVMALQLQGQAGCGGDVTFQDSSGLNAWSDGHHVVLTSAMVQLARSDDELAFVIAHEMAHNILGHASAQSNSFSLFGLLGFGSARVRRMEINADRFAVPLMNAGGYSPQGGVSFLETARRQMWWGDLSLDHPSFGRRIDIVNAAIQQLQPRVVAPYQTAQGGMTAPAPKQIAFVASGKLCVPTYCQR